MEIEEEPVVVPKYSAELSFEALNSIVLKIGPPIQDKGKEKVGNNEGSNH
jgi:hypothetical protein